MHIKVVKTLLRWTQSLVFSVGSEILPYMSDAADEVRMLFGHFLSQVHNHSTVIVLLRQKFGQKAVSPYLQHLTS